MFTNKLLLCFSVCALGWAIAPHSHAGDSAENYLAALQPALDARVIETLAAIDGTGRKLLATRAYLRSAAQLDERWSWNDAQIAAYQGSPEKLRLDAAIARVRCAFESANPGHTLFVNETIRSLDLQIARWNRSESIKRSADHMRETIAAELAAPEFPRASTPKGVSAFRELLVAHKPEPTPTLAAPGLSLHGRMQAVDFQVQAGDRIVAGPDTATVTEAWDSSGWKAKLQAAVKDANAGFVGPLQNPYEPWHYNFRPDPTGELPPTISACAGASR